MFNCLTILKEIHLLVISHIALVLVISCDGLICSCFFTFSL